MKLTKEMFVEWLNEIGCPEDDHPEIRNNTYGKWLRKNDPIAFEVGYNDWVRETRNS